MKPSKSEDYAKNHIWARKQTDNPYYLHSPTLKLYIAYKSQDTIASIFDGQIELKKAQIPYFKYERLNHCIIKLLIACFVHKDKKFISNNIFYLLSDAFSSKKGYDYANVIKIDPKLKHEKNINNNDTGILELYFKDRATRLRKTDYGSRNKRQIPFDFIELGEDQLAFKQLKVNNSIEDTYPIYEENTDKNYKTRIKHHSLENIEEFEKSRNTLLDKFTQNLVSYLSKIGLNVTSKTLALQQVAKKLSVGNLNYENFVITVLDYRFNQNVKTTKIIEKFNQQGYDISFKHGLLENIDKNDNVLILMDYSTGDCELTGVLANYDGKDGYKIVKDAGIKNSQGFCINPNHFINGNSKISMSPEEFLNYKSFSKTKFSNNGLARDFQISIEQLYLKSIINESSTSNNINIPKSSLLTNSVFIHCFTKNSKRHEYICYATEESFFIVNLKSEKALEILKSFGIKDLETLVQLRTNYDKWAKFNTGYIYLMLNHSGLIEINELNERVLYSSEIGNILKDRNSIRDKSEFLIQANNEVFSSDKVKKYNEFVEEMVEQQISFENLVKGGKYGLYRKKVMELLDLKNEKKLTKALGIKGKKSGGFLSTYQGIWFDENKLEYFVGDKAGYKYNQSKGYQIRKIIVHKGKFNPNEFFPLLNVDFIKHKNYTVLPYIFNLIKMYVDMEG